MLPNPDKPHMGAGAGAAGNFFYFMGWGGIIQAFNQALLLMSIFEQRLSF